MWMDSYRGMRASDEDRERAVRTLREAYAAGRLDLAELRQRAGAAYGARTWGELRPLTSDIPVWVIAAPGRPPATALGTAAGSGPGRLTAPVLLITLAAGAGVAAAWASAALLPLLILSTFILLAAACSLNYPALPSCGPPGQPSHGQRGQAACQCALCLPRSGRHR